MKGTRLMREQFTYAVARIRAKELSLLTGQDVSRLMACETYAECLNVLRDKGWPESDDYQKLLSMQESQLWQLVAELVSDRSLFNVLLLPIDFHNLKAAIKGHLTTSMSDDIFLSGGIFDKGHIVRCVEENKLEELPAYMVEPAKLAFEQLLHTGDGQLCDIILDKALLQAIKTEGSTSQSRLIRDYSEFYVASTNIKMAMRCQRLKKNLSFLRSILVECETLDIESLATATIQGQDSLCEYLEYTAYADAVPFIKESLQKFEFWRDNKIIELIKSEKTDSFSIGPIFAYILARQNEIKVVRIILSGKLNKIDNDLIKERLRVMYA